MLLQATQKVLRKLIYSTPVHPFPQKKTQRPPARSQPTNFSPPSYQDLPSETSKPNQQAEVLFVVNASVGHMAPWRFQPDTSVVVGSVGCDIYQSSKKQGSGVFLKNHLVWKLFFCVFFWVVNLVTLFLFWFPVMVADDFSDGALDGPG